MIRCIICFSVCVSEALWLNLKDFRAREENGCALLIPAKRLSFHSLLDPEDQTLLHVFTDTESHCFSSSLHYCPGHKTLILTEKSNRSKFSQLKYVGDRQHGRCSMGSTPLHHSRYPRPERVLPALRPRPGVPVSLAGSAGAWGRASAPSHGSHGRRDFPPAARSLRNGLAPPSATA